MVIILILWIGLVLWGISKNKEGQLPLNKSQALSLRGICAIEIMIGHIGLASGSIALYPNRKAGILFVGIFFLLSGYGVAYSVEYKKDYLKNFLLDRTVKLLLPAYIVEMIMIVAASFPPDFAGGGINLRHFFLGLNWYVWEQLLFYFVYWLIRKIIPAYVELGVGIFSVLFIFWAYISGMENPWYGSSLCFVLGLYYYQYEKKKMVSGDAVRHRNINYYLLLVSLLLITGMSILAFFILGNDSILGNPIARNIASVSFGIMVIMLLYRLKIGNRVSSFLGEFSYEIFLVHSYMLSILAEVSVKSKVLFGVLTVVLSVITAYLIHLLISRVFKVIDMIRGR